jgi:hypothetical protein
MTNNTLIPNREINYLDTNALINLWNIFIKTNKEGNSNININNTVFKNCYTSIYAIDEMLISRTRSQNKLLNNVTFLSIFKNIPIVKPFPEIAKMSKENNLEIIKYQENKNMISDLLFHCVAQYFSPKSQKLIDYHVQKKEEFSEASSWFIRPYGSKKTNYSKEKKPLEEKIDELICHVNIDKPENFLQFCMELFVAFRNREILKPPNLPRSKMRKKPEKSLNQQYDFYHLCYSKYASGFVTDDETLLWVSKTLSKKHVIPAKIYGSKSFSSKQFQELVLNKL